VKGIGWVCDDCNNTSVQVGSDFLFAGNPPLPGGWLMVVRNVSDPLATGDVSHFCSLACLEHWAGEAGE
jgi:hypothetical protein